MKFIQSNLFQISQEPENVFPIEWKLTLSDSFLGKPARRMCYNHSNILQSNEDCRDVNNDPNLIMKAIRTVTFLRLRNCLMGRK